MNEKDAAKFLKEGRLTINGHELDSEHLSIKYILKKENLAEHHELGGESEIKILLDVSQDEDMRLKGIAREIVNRVQKLRKKSKLNPDDDISIFVDYAQDSQLIKAAVESKRAFIEAILRKPFFSLDNKPKNSEQIANEEFDYEDEKFQIVICKNN